MRKMEREVEKKKIYLENEDKKKKRWVCQMAGMGGYQLNNKPAK